MEKAFVLLICESGSDDYVVSKLLSVESVTSAHGVFGPYDVIAVLECGTLKEIENVVTTKIRRLNKVMETITFLAEKRSKVLDEVFAKKQKDLQDKDLAKAFIIVGYKNMDEYDIMLNLSKIQEVIGCDVVLGQDVLMCEVAAPTYNEIEDVVTKKIRQLQGIASTMTLNVIPDSKSK